MRAWKLAVYETSILLSEHTVMPFGCLVDGEPCEREFLMGLSFFIAQTFTDSLARLRPEFQKAAKTTAFDLQINPASSGLKFHRIDTSKDRGFWSVRVNADLRLIVHKNESRLLLCYVDHHDKAYAWAERRRIDVHPTTGAVQFVEVATRIEEEVVRRPVSVAPTSNPRLFESFADSALLSFGVPADWLPQVQQATEDTILDIATHLPAEAAEALLEIATGSTPKAPALVVAEPAASYARAHTGEPFDHPDSRRRFRLVNTPEELERALEYPWDKWTIFLHPAQLESVEADYSGPARISGSAGTGKTVVAIHRAAFLARSHPESRVLLTTFSESLACSLRTMLRRLIGTEPRLAERIDVKSLDAISNRLYELNVAKPNLVTRRQLGELLAKSASENGGQKFSKRFLLSEWDQVVDAWQIGSWEEYRDVVRLGRKTRLPEAQRLLLWKVFDSVKGQLKSIGVVTDAMLLSRLAEHNTKNRAKPFDYIVVDECQDLSVAQLRFIASLGAGREDSLFFTGDLGQRIFQQPFSWKSLGIDIRGRSRTLRVNYRTSHQIRRQADRLLGPEVSDADGNVVERRGTISVFNGPAPEVKILKNETQEIQSVTDWLKKRGAEGVLPHDCGIFVRSETQLGRAKSAVTDAGLNFTVLDDDVQSKSGTVSIGTMHLAKGLEFRAVAVMACDDEVLPLQERIEEVGDDADLKDVYETERHLLYVACTRARDFLLVTAVEPGSEFLNDMLSK